MFLDVNGVSLHALSFGDGPRALLAVGGWTGSWKVWEEPIASSRPPAGVASLTTTAVPGSRRSISQRISVEAIISDVVGVLDAFGVERCVLAGESQGGAIAQYAVARTPERFDGLILSAATPNGRREGSSSFPDHCRTDDSAAAAAFVERCFPERDCMHVKRWARNVLLRAEPDQAARILEMWGDEAATDLVV